MSVTWTGSPRPREAVVVAEARRPSQKAVQVPMIPPPMTPMRRGWVLVLAMRV